MKATLRAFSFTLFLGIASTLSASTCPSTVHTTSDCDFLITIGTTGSATVSTVPNSTPFNGPITFADGTSDPGMNGSLVGVVNDDSQALKSFTLMGSGASAGIFDFSFNGICVYTKAAYCGTAQTGYEGSTTTFSNLMSTVLFQTNKGTVTFNPMLASGATTYFSIEDNVTDLTANGGLTVSNVSFAGSPTTTPEPADSALIGLGLSTLFFVYRKFKPTRA